MLARVPTFLLAVCFSFASLPDRLLAADDPGTSRKHVLFIAVDDLRPALGCYGDQTAISPQIDALARRSIQFQRAYCQQAVCSPSRLSLLTGRRPDTIQVWDLSTHFRKQIPDIVTLPQHFRNHGYQTQSVGKIFHGSGAPSRDPPSWSRDPLYDVNEEMTLRYALQRNQQGKGKKQASAESADVADDAYIDGQVCNAAIEALRDLARGDQPFFLAVGFRKPHLPFNAPQKYWDLYQREQIPAPATSQHPQAAPEFATRTWNELEGYSDIPADGQLSPEKVQELRHGYYACVSYIDALVGRVLQELQDLKLAENTVVVLWGDHGFHLGEQGLWTKANNFELATRVPLLISVPGQTDQGLRTDALVEFVDLYPTLADCCQLPAPEGVEGISLMPLIAQPQRPWKEAAFSQYPRSRTKVRHKRHGDVMGYAVRTDRFRYVEWVDWTTREVLARELYDHQQDPSEMKNLAGDPGLSSTVQQHSELLQRGWRSVIPDSE